MKDILNDKATLRSQLLHSRSLMGSDRRVAACRALRDALLALPEVVRAETVAAYVPVGSEPGGRDLAEDLAAGSTRRVLLPVLLADNDLDWAVYEGPASLVPASRGLREPIGPRLGVEGVRTADVLVVPGLAVDRRGLRLGRGGGSYDRALTRVQAAVTVVLLYDDEVLDRVPAEPHDVPVDVAVTPAAVYRFSR